MIELWNLKQVTKSQITSIMQIKYEKGRRLLEEKEEEDNSREQEHNGILLR